MYEDTPEELFFSRKFDIFRTYFSLRPSRIDKEVESILNYGERSGSQVAKAKVCKTFIHGFDSHPDLSEVEVNETLF